MGEVDSLVSEIAFVSSKIPAFALGITGLPPLFYTGTNQ
jgi:hypothetical protein